MLIYTKIVDNVRKLFGNYSGNVPTADDTELTYLKQDGSELTLQAGDTYVDGGSSDGVQRIKRLSDDSAVVVEIGNHIIIGGEVIPVVSSIAVKTAPTKTAYSVSETLDLTGLVITVTYTDSDTEDLAYTADGVVCSPANGATLTAEDTKVTITYSGKTCEQAITVT